MKSEEGSEVLSYSQAGQDLFIKLLFGECYQGVFVDVGCRLPEEINNTLLLEKQGWVGISLDIVDYGVEWKKSGRETGFICADALTFTYPMLNKDMVYDYLSLDIEGEGMRFEALKNIMSLDIQFKAITIEHDVYVDKSYDLNERQPQRELLRSLGYVLMYPDVTIMNKPFEDWWIKAEEISAKGIIRVQEAFGESPLFRDPDKIF